MPIIIEPGLVQILCVQKLSENIIHTIKTCPMGKLPLDKLITNMQKTMTQIGYKPNGMHFNGLYNGNIYNNAENFTLSVQDINELFDSAKIHYIEGLVNKEIINNFNSIANINDDGIIVKDTITAQLFAIVGKAYVLCDEKGESLPKSDKPHIIVSVPGINFAYSTSDCNFFMKNGSIDIEIATHRMKNIWIHILHCMKTYEVQIPCLNAIGCGAFVDKEGLAPKLWAQSLKYVLQNNNFGFVAIVMCLPDTSNYDAFYEVFKDTNDLSNNLILSNKSNMITTTRALSCIGYTTGMLNPSDWEAIMHGKLGMYWNGGHIALEEVIALTTTLLLHHGDVLSELYYDTFKFIPSDLGSYII